MDLQAAQSMSAPITTTTGKRSARRRRQPYGWLGAGALTLGVGAALAGAGVAHADDAAPAGSAGSARSAEASQAAVNSQKASPAGVRNRGAAVRTVGEAAATARTANTRVVAAGTSGRSAALATVSRKVAAMTVGSPSDAVVAPTTVAPVALPSYFGGFRTPPSTIQGAPRFEGTFGPGAPKPADFGVLAPLAWAVAEVAYHVQGLSPLARPNQLPSAPGDEEVVGTLNTVAAYGAPVTFAVTTQPTNGTVEIDAQGIYTYTPNAAQAAAGGFDSFVVTATDAGFHLENLFGLPGRATTMTVPVTVPATPAVPVTVDQQRTQAKTGFTTYTYTVVNNSSTTQTFGAVAKNQGNILAFPAVGTVLNPGESADYKVRSEQIPSTLIMQTLSSGSGTVAGILTTVLLDIHDEYDSSYPPKVQWEASCEPTAACSVPQGNGGTVRLFDSPGTVVVVPDSDTETREYVAQSVVASSQPNATFYEEGPNSAAATAPGAVTRKPPLGGVMMATSGNTTYLVGGPNTTWTPTETAALTLIGPTPGCVSCNAPRSY